MVIRSIGSDDTRFPHTGAMKREKSAALALPAGAISSADADLLERVLALPAGNPAPRLSVTLTPRWLPDADSANVVGEVVGRERPSDVVLLGAHLDSWDLGEGAIDDGAGCGIVLEAARALLGVTAKPRRTVRVVLFAAEENSLAGGKAYAVAHAAEVSTHVAALEADSGTNRVLHAALRGAPDARGAFQGLASLLAPLGVTLVDKEAHGGADVSPLEALGVPIVDMSQDPSHYFDHHHTANDVFARIDKGALAQASAAFATMAWGIAELPGDLGRIPEADRAHK